MYIIVIFDIFRNFFAIYGIYQEFLEHFNTTFFLDILQVLTIVWSSIKNIPKTK